jgi:predicted RNase H-like HicB family nuclease
MDILKKPYMRVLIPEDSGGYSAKIIEFQGCFAEGETVEEAFSNLEKAAEAWIIACKEKNQAIPEPIEEHQCSGKIALRLPRSLHYRAMALANTEGVSLNQFLVNAISEFTCEFENSPKRNLQFNFYQGDLGWFSPKMKDFQAVPRLDTAFTTGVSFLPAAFGIDKILEITQNA